MQRRWSPFFIFFGFLSDRLFAGIFFALDRNCTYEREENTHERDKDLPATAHPGRQDPGHAQDADPGPAAHVRHVRRHGAGAHLGQHLRIAAVDPDHLVFRGYRHALFPPLHKAAGPGISGLVLCLPGRICRHGSDGQRDLRRYGRRGEAPVCLRRHRGSRPFVCGAGRHH